MSETNKLIGTIHTTDQGRDAIHVAVVQVIADEALIAGQHIGVIKPNLAVARPAYIGIVDPFIQNTIMKGDKFYIFLYPNTVTSIRHAWEHPAFGRDTSKAHDTSKSEQWIAELADSIVELSYQELLDGAKNWLVRGNMLHGEFFEGINIPDEFWDHYAAVSGLVAPENKRQSFFSCSC